MSDTTDTVYEFIVKFKLRHNGNSPTLREIAHGCDLSSNSTVTYHVNKLKEDGRVVVRDGMARSIDVAGSRWLPPGGYGHGA